VNKIDLGSLRHWQEGDIHYAENALVKLAWVYTTDSDLDGKMGWYGPDQICVQYKLRKAVDRLTA
jgi:hypothetical protein